MTYQHLPCDQISDRSKLYKEATEAVAELGESQIDHCWEAAGAIGASIWKRSLTAGTLAALEMWKSNTVSTTIILDDFLREKDFSPNLPPTPVDRGLLATENQVRWADILLLGLMKLINLHPTAIHAENEGHLVRNVIPSQSKTEEQSSHGSLKPFTWHSDQLNCNLRREPIDAACPDALCFIVLRNSEEVKTRIVSNEIVLDELRYKSVRLLRDPHFRIAKPESNDLRNDQLFPTLDSTRVIVPNEDGSNFVRYDPQAVSVANRVYKGHRQALRDLESVLRKIEVEPLVFRPGQFIIFKNRKVLHSREAFQPNPDLSKARWLRRIYGVYADLP